MGGWGTFVKVVLMMMMIIIIIINIMTSMIDIDIRHSVRMRSGPIPPELIF